jgi:hypothetical protein
MKPKRKSASQTAHYQKTSIAMTDIRLNDHRPSIDDPRLDQNISLEEQRERLEAVLESETDAGTIPSLLGKIDVLDARKAENELLASKVPNSEVMYMLTATAIVSCRTYHCSKMRLAYL